ncbi:hypothetical protein FNH22_05725 [Fulvivirga sp. M361]|uniref:hypothetical protein n=1 Tax=Fulvivirga sp. M361 TaxID=2594266 RepID=UPI00117A7BA9|nr:hypothetical protein [Fulvivirga sp. M361]TRX60548.1 hypothetical protein FNH22_05725 [Fulvivirga sp. M361]
MRSYLPTLLLFGILMLLLSVSCEDDNGSEDEPEPEVVDPPTKEEPEEPDPKSFENCSDRSNNIAVEVDGIVIVEAENVVLTDDHWKLNTSLPEYSGEGYIVWEGPAQFWKGIENIGKTGKLTYKVKISTTGTYQFVWRSYIAKKDPEKPGTEHNDSWLRIAGADDFFAKKSDGSVVYPKGTGKTPNPAGENGNGFFKVYMNIIDKWTWVAGTFDNNFHTIFATFDEAGIYEIEIAPRSDFHAIDRFALFHSSASGEVAQNVDTQISHIDCEE